MVLLSALPRGPVYGFNLAILRLAMLSTKISNPIQTRSELDYPRIPGSTLKPVSGVEHRRVLLEPTIADKVKINDVSQG